MDDVIQGLMMTVLVGCDFLLGTLVFAGVILVPSVVSAYTRRCDAEVQRLRAETVKIQTGR